MTSLTQENWTTKTTTVTGSDPQRDSTKTESHWWGYLVNAPTLPDPRTHTQRNSPGWVPEEINVYREVKVSPLRGETTWTTVTINGHHLKKDGTVGSVAEDERWSGVNGRHSLLTLPVWVRTLAEDVSALTFVKDHHPQDARQVEYPGGKDGMWRAGCSCGYQTTFCDTVTEALDSRDQHVQAVTS